jgi:hypothetical protein
MSVIPLRTALKNGELLSGKIPPEQKIKRKSTKNTDKGIPVPERTSCFKAAMLVLLAASGRDDKWHATRWTLASEFEG